MDFLFGFTTLYVLLFCGSQTTLYPGATAQSPSRNVPPLDLTNTWNRQQNPTSNNRSPPFNPWAQQQQPQQFPPWQLPPQQPQLSAQPSWQSPSQDQSPFGAQLPYNPQSPSRQHYMPQPPPYHYMGRMGGRAECSGGFVPGQLCCDGIVNPMPPGGGLTQWACCHKGIYDFTTQMCCGDIPVPKPKGGPPLMCCGTMLYNPATHLCCDSFPVLNPLGTMKCCRKTAYNPANTMCCAETVRPRNPLEMNMDCCGKHMYNPLTHMCCSEGNAILRDPSYRCCGKNFYQPTTQQCCFGDALPIDAGCIAK